MPGRWRRWSWPRPASSRCSPRFATSTTTASPRGTGCWAGGTRSACGSSTWPSSAPRRGSRRHALPAGVGRARRVLAAFVAGVALSGEPEAVIDASRYFVQAKSFARGGWEAFCGAGGANPRLDRPAAAGAAVRRGLPSRGEHRLPRQLLSAALFALTAAATAGIGRLLWGADRRARPLLLLAIPCLLVHVPLLMADVPAMAAVTGRSGRCSTPSGAAGRRASPRPRRRSGGADREVLDVGPARRGRRRSCCSKRCAAGGRRLHAAPSRPRRARGPGGFRPRLARGGLEPARPAARLPVGGAAPLGREPPLDVPLPDTPAAGRRGARGPLAGVAAARPARVLAAAAVPFVLFALRPAAPATCCRRSRWSRCWQPAASRRSGGAPGGSRALAAVGFSLVTVFAATCPSCAGSTPRTSRPRAGTSTPAA